MNIFIFSQVIIAFFMGVASLFLVYRLLNIYLRRAFKITELNQAFATLQTGIILSTALMVSSIIGPGLNAIRFINQADISFNTVSISVGYMLMFLLIGIIFTFLVIAGGIVVLFQLTRINEWEEIRNNNIPVALISAALILGLSLIMRDHVASVCEMLVPYPEVLQIR
jgi:uncharacterized membrane protein YjfL (UPF0719 family)